ncbi:uncharacterized protein Hap1MRO34_003642 [Clarias gariepinus]
MAQKAAHFKCAVFACKKGHTSVFLPPSSEQVKAKWISFIYGRDIPADVPKFLYVCAKHFTSDCFLNEGQFKAGFASRLRLKPGSVPTIRGEAPDPEAVGDVLVPELRKKAVPCVQTSSLLFLTQSDAACQTDPPLQHTRSTQLSLRTLQPHFRSAAVQATLSSHDRSNDKSTDALQLSPLLLSPAKRLTERARTEAFKNVQTPEGSNILQSREVLVSTQCLLELFQFCWLCQIECSFTIEGNEKLFSITQYCQSCDHHRDWRSQPPSAEPAGNENHETQHELMNEEDEDDDGSEIVVQIVSSDNEGSDQMFIDEDGSYLSSNDEEASSEEEEVRRKRKRKSKSGDSSDDWEPRLEEEITDSNGSADEDQKEDGQRKLVVWCTECQGEATRSCSVHQHKKTFCCARCGSGDTVQTHTLETLPVRFDDFGSFQIHAEQEHGAKSFFKLCQDCGKIHTAKKEHVCEHKTKFIVCPECGKRFITEGGLKIHYTQLHSDYDHPCKYCLKVFKTKPAKLEHEQTHPVEDQPYSCPDCSETFDNIHKRNKHVRSHRGPHKYVCDVCDKGFKRINRLRRHKLIHSGEKPFRCQVCERSFNQMENLTSHMRVHTGEKPFACEQCGDSFSHNISLKIHKQRHHKAGLTHEEEENINDLE